MRVAILDGTAADDPAASVVNAALARAVDARGWAARRLVLRDMEIPRCLGCFECWIHTPGLCIAKGDADTVARTFIGSDVVVMLTRVTFGGYSSQLKKGLDHCIGLISPFFKRIDGETHHKKRYARYPAVIAIGVQRETDPEQRDIFETLVSRNALNLHSPAHRAIVVAEPLNAAALGAQIDAAFEAVGGVRPSTRREPQGEPEVLEGANHERTATPSSALLLVGSPKKGMSTSEVFGSHLLDRLGNHGVRGTAVRLHRVLRSSGSPAGLLGLVDEADLVILATPLYVDSLPSHVIAALEIIAARRAETGAPRQQRVACVLNCGFPEAHHNETAIRICRRFAREAHLHWAGGLALGAGEVIGGRPLAKIGGMARGIAAALNQVGDALAAGNAIPGEAAALMAKPLVPIALFPIAGDLFWRVRARKFGAQWRLHSQPYG